MSPRSRILKHFQAYIACATASEIGNLKLNWNFPKTHLWKHATRDIRRKGVARNYSTRPNEKLHGPLKDAYHHQTNGKDIAPQVRSQFTLVVNAWTDAWNILIDSSH